MSVVSALFQRRIRQEVDSIIVKVIDDLLPPRVEEVVAKRLEQMPTADLTSAGFGWALSIALRKHWPEIDGKTAARWLWDYVGVPFGTRGYGWTYADAREIASQYVAQFGEHQP